MRAIDSIYSEYCKRHEDAVLKLQELEVQPEIQAFLNVSYIHSWRRVFWSNIVSRNAGRRFKERRQVGIWAVY